MAELKTEVPLLKMGDGATIPMIGFGTGTAMFKSENDTKINKDLVEQIKTAIKCGYTHLDGAESYNNEPELGTAIKESKVPRDKLFVTTKITSVSDIAGTMDASLKKLKLDYVDLCLLHSPWSEGNNTLKERWMEMEALKAAGKAKSIGVSNFLIPHLEQVLEGASEKPAINQLEYHLYLQRRELYDFHKKHDIALAAYAPLTPILKAKGGPVDPLLASLAKKYAVNEAEICMRWVLDRGVAFITTSSKEQRLSDYMRVTAFKLTPKEVDDLAEAGDQRHFRGFMANKFADDDRS